MSDTRIAIVGMAGRFPGARTVGELWRNLVDGVEAVRVTGPARPGFVPAAASMDGVDLFDAPFFGISAAYADIMDPQHRVFLEVAWEALEDAGYDAARCSVSIGVYAGATANTYFAMNLSTHADLFERFTAVDVNTANAADFLTTRFSYVANLRGPSHAVQSACSTSLVAVCSACQALLDGQCDMALAGGVSVNVAHLDGYRFVDGGMFSPDGHCRPFSADAAGTIFGNGAGVVVLKRWADAIRDRDHVYAVILGSAINNDGREKVGYLAPGVGGQAAVIAEALEHAGVPADSIGYVEAHGTGTPVGDPIEVLALTNAFGATAERQFCGLGSVKSNIGHLDAAAGVTGLIKAALIVSTGVVPGMPQFSDPNPAIDFTRTPFYVASRTQPWTAKSPRRAGVSAFGVGGTNAHVIVEEPPPRRAASTDASWHVLTVSARSPAALREQAHRLAAWLAAHPSLPIADVAYTLQVGRRAFRHRRAIVCCDVQSAVAALEAVDAGCDTAGDEDRRVEVVFSGDGGGLSDLLAARARDSAAVRRVRDSGAGTSDAFAPHRALAAALRQLGVDVGRADSGSAARPSAESILLAIDGASEEAPRTVSIDTTEPSAERWFARVLGLLWEHGAAIDWTACHAGATRWRVALPTYPFEHRRYWLDRIEAPGRSNVPAAIAKSDTPRPVLSSAYSAPATLIERQIAATWTRLLGIDDIGVDDNFFELGGDSMLAVRAAAELRTAVGCDIPPSALYEGVTIRHLAQVLTSRASDDADRDRAARLKQAHRARRREGRSTVFAGSPEPRS